MRSVNHILWRCVQHITVPVEWEQEVWEPYHDVESTIVNKWPLTTPFFTLKKNPEDAGKVEGMMYPCCTASCIYCSIAFCSVRNRWYTHQPRGVCDARQGISGTTVMTMWRLPWILCFTKHIIKVHLFFRDLHLYLSFLTFYRGWWQIEAWTFQAVRVTVIWPLGDFFSIPWYDRVKPWDA